jgi:hypothetical protein
MTLDQIITAANKYLAAITEARGGSAGAMRYPSDLSGPTASSALSHAAWMCQELVTFAAEKPEKAERWLCFVQGALWTVDGWTIDEFREDNR